VISDEVQYVIDPEDHAKVMYNKLRAKMVKQSSGSSANSMQIKLVYKQFKDEPMMENFEKHLTFYHSKNATLNAVGAGFNDSFLAWLLLNLFSPNNNPIWSMASTNIVMSDVLINQWSFNHISGKLHNALCNNICPTERELSSTSQMVLNATTSNTSQSHYNGPPCTYPNCCCPKTHATDDCWTKQKDEQDKVSRKKHKAKKAKRRSAKSSSELEASSGSDSDTKPKKKTCHHAHRSRIEPKQTLRVLRAVSHHV
jgi:hypothetical protein